MDPLGNIMRPRKESNWGLPVEQLLVRGFGLN